MCYNTGGPEIRNKEKYGGRNFQRNLRREFPTTKERPLSLQNKRPTEGQRNEKRIHVDSHGDVSCRKDKEKVSNTSGEQVKMFTHNRRNQNS